MEREGMGALVKALEEARAEVANRRDPERHIIFQRLDRDERLLKMLDGDILTVATAVSDRSRRLRNLERAFAAVSFIFAVHLLIDLFRCL
jgi:hypothetical protein